MTSLLHSILMRRRKYALLAAGLLAGPALAADMSVIQKDLVFNQTAITVGIGDKVMWGNADHVTHNIHIKGIGNAFDEDMGLQKYGMVISHNFDVAGSFQVICSIHPHMKMIVVVK